MRGHPAAERAHLVHRGPSRRVCPCRIRGGNADFADIAREGLTRLLIEHNVAPMAELATLSNGSASPARGLLGEAEVEQRLRQVLAVS